MDPEDVAFARDGSGVLYITDGVNREVYRVDPGANGLFDGISPVGDDQVISFDTWHVGLDDPEAIAFNPDTGHLWVIGKPAGIMFEFTTEGVLVQTIDISAAQARKPTGLAVAPSSRRPAAMSIYIAARGVDNDTNPDENDGKVYEMVLDSSPYYRLIFFPYLVRPVAGAPGGLEATGTEGRSFERVVTIGPFPDGF